MAEKAKKIHYEFNAYRRDVMVALGHTKLSGADFRVILLILAQTDGFLRPEDKMKAAFFREKIGLYDSNLRRTIGRLRAWNMISKEGKTYMVLPPEQWKPECFLSNRNEMVTVSTLGEPPDRNEMVTEQEKRNGMVTVPENPDRNEMVTEFPPTVTKSLHHPHEIVTVLATSKDNSSKDNLPKDNSSSSLRSKRLKPKQEEAGMFITWVSREEGVPMTEAKLVALARRALVATEAKLEDLQDWYRWVKQHDEFWKAREPPVILSHILDKFPTWLRDRKEGKLHGAEKRLSERGRYPAQPKPSGQEPIKPRESGPDDKGE